MNYMQPAVIMSPAQMADVEAAAQLVYEAMRQGDNRQPYVGALELRLELVGLPDGTCRLRAVCVEELRR